MDFSADYDFPGPFKPMDNQKRRFNFLMANPRALDASLIATGKTATSPYGRVPSLMRETGGAILILTTVSTVDVIWRKSIVELFCAGREPLVDYHILSGSLVQKAKTINNVLTGFVVGNHDILQSQDVRDAIIRNEALRTIIVDESDSVQGRQHQPAQIPQASVLGAEFVGADRNPDAQRPLERLWHSQVLSGGLHRDLHPLQGAHARPQGAVGVGAKSQCLRPCL